MTQPDNEHAQLGKAELEQAIAATPGEKVTDADLDNAIVATQFEYPTLPPGTLTLCIITLRNGFNVVGESACVDPTNYNKEIGDTIAYNNARNKIWLLEGYALAERRRLVLEGCQERSLVDKLRDEYDELAGRVERLTAFIGGDRYKSLTSHEQDDLREQLSLMEQYETVLHRRIERKAPPVAA